MNQICDTVVVIWFASTRICTIYWK